MVSRRPRTPPQHLWLIFDFTVLSIQEIKDVYLLIKNDSDISEDIVELVRCYKLKKAEAATRVPDIQIPIMKKAGYVKVTHSPPTIKRVVDELGDSPMKITDQDQEYNSYPMSPTIIKRVKSPSKIPIMTKAPRKGIVKEPQSSNGKKTKYRWWPF